MKLRLPYKSTEKVRDVTYKIEQKFTFCKRIDNVLILFGLYKIVSRYDGQGILLDTTEHLI